MCHHTGNKVSVLTDTAAKSHCHFLMPLRVHKTLRQQMRHMPVIDKHHVDNLPAEGVTIVENTVYTEQ